MREVITLDFRDGTTDVTRTWHFGTPTAFEKECFTRVLKGQMALGTAVFPRKIKVSFKVTVSKSAK
jgi:Xaa-Pro aminopeptidase